MVTLVLISAYMLGSIPFGYLFARLIGNCDIRQHGSGNIGATNILRVLGWKTALPVFILDLLKGFCAVTFARLYSDSAYLQLAAGMLAMLGHSFPVFLSFRGGKAVATASGVLLAISGWVTLALFAGALVVLSTTRYVSLASLVGSLLVPLMFWLFGYGSPYIYFGLALAALIIIRHQSNIKRLLAGTEPKLKFKAG